MNKYRYWFLIAFLLTVLQTSAQWTSRNPYEQRKFQLGVHVGTLNYGLDANFKLIDRLSLAVESGWALVYLNTGTEVNKFNHNYSQYNQSVSNILDLGYLYQVVYSDVSLRYLFGQNSRVVYNSAPYANTFGYLAARFRINSAQTNRSFDGGGVELSKFRETYLLSLLVGRRVELEKTSLMFFDFSAGPSVIGNYKINTFTLGLLLSVKVGFNVWNVNK